MHDLRRKSWDNMGVALIAAYMLILQGLLGAFATGAADAAGLDAFGNPLCITSGMTTSVDTDAAHHKTLPDCCAMSCGMFASAAHDDRAPHSLENPLTVALHAPSAPFAVELNGFALERRPGSPRSPPLTA